MADRPLLFSGPMVRALLDGRKTQTRRVAKITAIMGNKAAITAPEESLIELEDGEFRAGRFHYLSNGALSGPYQIGYAVGDRLYVREAWNTWGIFDDLSPSKLTGKEGIAFAADMSNPRGEACGRLRAGMHMPRWASRLTLTVTDVRVQRVQDIDDDDAIAEGVTMDGATAGVDVDIDGGWWPSGPRNQYKQLWNSLNETRGFGWKANPWVVALTFTVERRNIDQMESDHA